jgi:HlyD family secretion protein
MANHHRGKRKRRWWILGIAIVVPVVGIVLGASALRKTPPIDPSKLGRVERGDIARSVVATGKIEPLVKVEVKSKASGIVKKILVDAGDRVRAGQILVELDKEQLEANVREAQAQLQAARAAREAAYATWQRNTVDALGPDVPFLKSAMVRARKLYAGGLIAEAAREDAEKSYEMALNKQLSAERNVAVSEAGVAQAKAQVAVAQAGLERAGEDLRYSTIRSPMDGLVLSRDVEVGDAVSSILVLGSQSTLVMTLGDTSSVYVRGKVDEADIGKVYLGQPARISVEAFPDRKFKGQVTKIAPLGREKDNVTTFEVRVSIANPTGALRANMSANAEIILQEKRDVLLVPEGALVYDPQRHVSVEVPDPGQSIGWKKAPVTIGITNGVKAEVLSGLVQGEKVILQ